MSAAGWFLGYTLALFTMVPLSRFATTLWPMTIGVLTSLGLDRAVQRRPTVTRTALAGVASVVVGVAIVFMANAINTQDSELVYWAAVWALMTGAAAVANRQLS